MKEVQGILLRNNRTIQYHLYMFPIPHSKSIYSSVVIATGYRLDGQGSIPSRGKRFFSSPQHPDQLWGLPSLLSNGYWGLCPHE
jgi:hypothetical protein